MDVYKEKKYNRKRSLSFDSKLLESIRDKFLKNSNDEFNNSSRSCNSSPKSARHSSPRSDIFSSLSSRSSNSSPRKSPKKSIMISPKGKKVSPRSKSSNISLDINRLNSDYISSPRNLSPSKLHSPKNSNNINWKKTFLDVETFLSILDNDNNTAFKLFKIIKNQGFKTFSEFLRNDLNTLIIYIIEDSFMFDDFYKNNDFLNNLDTIFNKSIEVYDKIQLNSILIKNNEDNSNIINEIRDEIRNLSFKIHRLNRNKNHSIDILSKLNWKTHFKLENDFTQEELEEYNLTINSQKYISVRIYKILINNFEQLYISLQKSLIDLKKLVKY
jgi:hypothetical protein